MAKKRLPGDHGTSVPTNRFVLCPRGGFQHGPVAVEVMRGPKSLFFRCPLCKQGGGRFFWPTRDFNLSGLPDAQFWIDMGVFVPEVDSVKFSNPPLPAPISYPPPQLSSLLSQPAQAGGQAAATPETAEDQTPDIFKRKTPS